MTSHPALDLTTARHWQHHGAAVAQPPRWWQPQHPVLPSAASCRSCMGRGIFQPGSHGAVCDTVEAFQKHPKSCQRLGCHHPKQHSIQWDASAMTQKAHVSPRPRGLSLHLAKRSFPAQVSCLECVRQLLETQPHRPGITPLSPRPQVCVFSFLALIKHYLRAIKRFKPP